MTTNEEVWFQGTLTKEAVLFPEAKFALDGLVLFTTPWLLQPYQMNVSLPGWAVAQAAEILTERNAKLPLLHQSTNELSLERALRNELLKLTRELLVPLAEHEDRAVAELHFAGLSDTEVGDRDTTREFISAIRRSQGGVTTVGKSYGLDNMAGVFLKPIRGWNFQHTLYETLRVISHHYGRQAADGAVDAAILAAFAVAQA